MAAIGWWLAVLAAAAGAQVLQGTCTIDVPDRAGALGRSPDQLVSGTLGIGEVVEPGSLVQSDAGNWVALRLEAVPAAQSGAAGPLGQAAVYLGPVSRVAVSPGAEAFPHLQVQQGMVVVSYEPAADGSPALLVSLPGGWVRLQRGTLAVTAVEAGSDAALLVGQASRGSGAVPQEIQEGAAAAMAVQVDAPLAQEGVGLVDRVTRAGIAQASQAWLVVASQGDLTPVKQPAAPGGAEVRAVEAPAAQVTPPAVSMAALASVVSLGALTPALNQAESLLTSGSPASVIVGARLERTRIVGTPSGIGFNILARPPLRLGF